MEPNARLEQLWELVQSIPVGKVCGYGDLGQALQNPVSGLLIGRWMSVMRRPLNSRWKTGRVSAVWSSLADC